MAMIIKKTKHQPVDKEIQKNKRNKDDKQSINDMDRCVELFNNEFSI